MRNTPRLAALGCAALVAAIALTREASTVQAQAKAQEQLATDAFAVLTRYDCFRCHGDNPKNLRGDLNLRDIPKILKSKDQQIILTKKPRDSALIQRVEDLTMPLSRTLPRLKSADIKVLSDWIAAGAPLPNVKAVVPLPVLLQVEAPPPNVTDVLRKHCADCHGGSKPESGLRIFDRQALLNKRIVIPKDAASSPLFQRVATEDDLVMPPPGAGRTRLTPAEVASIKGWIDAGAPPLEAFVTAPAKEIGEEYVLATILTDVKALRAANDIVSKYRYFSFNHLLAQQITPESLEGHRQALAFIMNSVSRMKKLVRPEPIDAAKTIYRVDIAQLGWDRQPYKIIRAGKEAGDSTVTIFDLLLLEYPYATFWEGSATFQQLVTDFLQPADQVAPVVFVRGDWFINAASRPPLYEDMLQLPFELGELEKLLEVPSEIDLKNPKVRRAGVTVSGVSRNNRVVERMDSPRSAYYWKSYDFSTSKGLQNMFRNPIELNHAGGEMIWALPNGLQAYYVCNQRGQRLDFAPTEIVTDTFAADKIVRNGLSCMRCHEAGLRGFKDDVRPAFENMQGSTPAFGLETVRRLYPEQRVMDTHLREDGDGFRQALKGLYGDQVPGMARVLDQASSRFMDEPLSEARALAELGLPPDENPPNGKKFAASPFERPTMLRLGLAQLAYRGAVRRDTWDDHYDQVVRDLRSGQPLVPLDAVGRNEYQVPDSPDIALEVRDFRDPKKKKVTFVPGDKVLITVKNTSEREVFIDMVGTSIRGFKVPLLNGIRLKPGAETRFPADGSAMVVGGNKGKEQITVWASVKALPSGELLRLSTKAKDQGHGMMDRLVHPFYTLRRDTGGNFKLAFDPSTIVKKTVEITTE